MARTRLFSVVDGEPHSHIISLETRGERNCDEKKHVLLGGRGEHRNADVRPCGRRRIPVARLRGGGDEW